MPFITSAERLGLEKGRVEGRVEGRVRGLGESLLELLEFRFGPVPTGWQQRIEAVQDAAVLKRALRRCTVVQSLTELEADFPPELPSEPPLTGSAGRG
jgi:predicted transposase YdaD